MGLTIVLKIYFHIGAGKTGTSTIQQYLKSHQESLSRDGAFYAGMCFETLGKDKAWKKKTRGYAKLSGEDFINELTEEIEKYIAYCKVHNLSKLIVSNESFSIDMKKFIPLFKQINQKYELQIIHYLRKPEDWLVSAYQQWGIKDKVKSGKIISSKKFLRSGRQNTMLTPIRVLNKSELGHCLIVRNLNACVDSDVTSDFCKLVGVKYQQFSSKNQKLDDFDEVLYFLTNDREIKRKSPRKGQSYLKLLKRGGARNKILSKININKEHFIANEMVDFRKEANAYLDNDQKFKEEFEPREKQNSADSKIVNCIKFFVANFEDVEKAKVNSDTNAVTVTDLRLAAESMETINLEVSYRLICAAVKLRPNGQKLREILTDYEKDLKNGIKVRKPPYEGKLSLLRKLFSFKKQTKSAM